MMPAALTGFATGFSLILAIGAQNAFVLRQGLMQQHVLAVCLVCAVSDAILIAIGVAGAGSIAAAWPDFVVVMSWAGALFLICYGALAAWRAFHPDRLEAARHAANSRRSAILVCLALTWLNPHVYLDTVALIGAISTRFAALPSKVAFAGGAVVASFVFFFSLGYGARILAPFFAREDAWAILDGIIALIMWTIAASLIWSVL